MIWIVNPFDNLPSEGNRPQRYWLMSEAFVRAGHRVVYWTSNFSHAHKRVRVDEEGECAGQQEGIEVVQIPTLPYKKNVCWARVRSHRQLARDFEARARERLKESSAAPDVVIASTPPLGLCAAAMRVTHLCGARFVCDIQDAWPETFERLLPRFVWAISGMYGAARRLYCGADGVSAVAKRYLDLAKERGSVAPMHLAGHAIEMSSVGRADREDGIIRLVYAGNMSLSYDLETVIRAVLELPDVTLDLAGDGPDRDRLERLVNGECRRIRFHGYLGKCELLNLLCSCDVGIIPMFPESCVGVPGKLADYAAAGLRVIESLGGECREIVAKYNAGVHYTAGDGVSLNEALRKIGHVEISNTREFAEFFDAKRIMDEYVRWCAEEVK